MITRDACWPGNDNETYFLVCLNVCVCHVQVQAQALLKKISKEEGMKGGGRREQRMSGGDERRARRG